MKIIAIDDQLVNCQILKAYLKKWGYDADIFSDSLKGFEALKNLKEPTLAIVDWMMPEMDGLEICTKIKENPPEFPIYLMMLTAKSSIEDISDGLISGADDYVSKPFNEKELKSRIFAGVRVLDLQTKVLDQKNELEVINKQLNKSLTIIKRDEEAGRTIQFKLLPKNNKNFDDYHFTHHLSPSLYLSGDFLDYFKIDKNHICFYFADVSGHGASSAFITVLLKSYISKYIEQFNSVKDQTILRPKGILEQINQEIIKANLDKHLTLFYGIIDIEKNLLTYSNGGQFPFPIIYDYDKPKYINAKSLPLGLMDIATFEENSLKLPARFKLFLFSDGILEILSMKDLNEQQEYLLSSVSTPDVDISKLLKIIKLPSEELPDDITMLILTKN